MTKKILCFITLILSLQFGFSQQKFYETKWNTSGIEYHGLLVYTSDNDAFMRINYTTNGSVKIASFNCNKVAFNDDGIKGYYWDGKNAVIIKGSSSSYNADNFYFIDKGGYYSTPMHIDDYGMNQANKANYYTTVDYWKEVKPSSFTNSYLLLFFNSYETYYDKLSMLKLTSSDSAISNTTTSNPSSTSFSSNPSSTTTTSNKSYTDTYLYDDSDLGSIYNNGYYKEKWLIRTTFPKDDINTLWNENYNINSVSYAKNKWVADLTNRGKTYTQQRWFTRIDFPKDDIEKGWNDGFYINKITYGNKLWAVVMSKNNYYGQSWKTRVNYPREEIDEEWADGKAIIELNYQNNLWVLVMSKGTGLYAQTIIREAKFPEEKIKAGWDDGKQITSLRYGNGVWIVVMSKGSETSLQRWRTRVSFPKDEIQKGWQDGYQITALEYNDSSKLWALVMSKLK